MKAFFSKPENKKILKYILIAISFWVFVIMALLIYTGISLKIATETAVPKNVVKNGEFIEFNQKNFKNAYNGVSFKITPDWLYSRDVMKIMTTDLTHTVGDKDYRISFGVKENIFSKNETNEVNKIYDYVCVPEENIIKLKNDWSIVKIDTGSDHYSYYVFPNYAIQDKGVTPESTYNNYTVIDCPNRSVNSFAYFKSSKDKVLRILLQKSTRTQTDTGFQTTYERIKDSEIDIFKPILETLKVDGYNENTKDSFKIQLVE